MAARTNKIRHDEQTRLKIKTSQLINRLQNHALGECDMTSTQVRAAEIALKKVLPDLSESSVTHTHKRDAIDYSREDLQAYLAKPDSRDGSAGTVEEDGRGGQPDSVH